MSEVLPLEPVTQRVLVAEHDQIVLALVSHLLTRRGYAVHGTLNDAEAEILLAGNTYAAVLIDVTMPSTGLELIRRLAVRDPLLLRRTIVMTPTIELAAPLAEFPLYAIVKKPFEISDLIATVRSCVTPDVPSDAEYRQLEA